jgi:hypothetical protein
MKGGSPVFIRDCYQRTSGEIRMTKAHAVAVVVALTLAGSTPSFAVNQTFATKNAVKWHPRAVNGTSVHSGSTIYPYDSDPHKGENRSRPLGETWPGNGAM